MGLNVDELQEAYAHAATQEEKQLLEDQMNSLRNQIAEKNLQRGDVPAYEWAIGKISQAGRQKGK